MSVSVVQPECIGVLLEAVVHPKHSSSHQRPHSSRPFESEPYIASESAIPSPTSSPLSAPWVENPMTKIEAVEDIHLVVYPPTHRIYPPADPLQRQVSIPN